MATAIVVQAPFGPLPPKGPQRPGANLQTFWVGDLKSCKNGKIRNFINFLINFINFVRFCQFSYKFGRCSLQAHMGTKVGLGGGRGAQPDLPRSSSELLGGCAEVGASQGGPPSELLGAPRRLRGGWPKGWLAGGGDPSQSSPRRPELSENFIWTPSKHEKLKILYFLVNFMKILNISYFL